MPELPLIHYLITHAVIAVLPIVIGLFVYVRSPKTVLFQTFLFYNASISWWAFFVFVRCLTDNEALALWLNRLGVAGIAFIPTASFHFSLAYLERSRQARHLIRACYALGAVFQVLCFTPWLIPSVSRKGFVPHFTDPGPLYPFFMLFFAGTMLGVVIMFSRALVTEPPGRRRQGILYFLVVTTLAIIGGGANFLVSHNIFIPFLVPYGNYAVVIYAVVTGFIIVRYRFFEEIEVLIKRTLVFAGLSLAVLGIVGMASLWLPGQLLALFGMRLGLFWPNALAAILIAAGYGPLRAWLIDVTDRYLFQKSYDYAALLRRFTDEVMALVDLRQLVQMTVATVSETMKLEQCSLWLQEPASRQFEHMASRGLPVRPVPLPPDAPLIAFLAEHPQPITLEDAAARHQLPEPVRAQLETLRSRVCVPLLRHEAVAGLLCLGKKKSDAGFTQGDLDILYSLSTTLSIAIANAQLFAELARTQAEVAEQESRATTDALTGLLVRRAFMERAADALGRAVRQDRPCSLLMADLDHFKEKNDTHGHLAGDAVLQEVALRLGRTLRAQDLLGRFGGEEFILYLDGTSRPEAQAVAERLRGLVAGTPILAEQTPLAQTISLGIAQCPEEGTALDALIARADQALYAAKRAGRNRVEPRSVP